MKSISFFSMEKKLESFIWQVCIVSSIVTFMHLHHTFMHLYILTIIFSDDTSTYVYDDFPIKKHTESKQWKLEVLNYKCQFSYTLPMAMIIKTAGTPNASE